MDNSVKKRSFQDPFLLSDNSLQILLDRISTIETSLDNIIKKQRRFTPPLLPKPKNGDICKLILRLIIRHSFIPAAEGEKAKFILNIEGFTFRPGTPAANNSINNSFRKGLGAYIRRISLQGKQLAAAVQLEWSEDSYPQGVGADYVEICINHDKPFTAHIELNLAGSVIPRYRLSPMLQGLLPRLSIDSTQEDICLAFISMLCQENLFLEGGDPLAYLSTDHRSFRCTEAIRALLGCEEYISIHQLWESLKPHVTQIESIEFDHYFSVGNQEKGTDKGNSRTIDLEFNEFEYVTKNSSLSAQVCEINSFQADIYSHERKCRQRLLAPLLCREVDEDLFSLRQLQQIEQCDIFSKSEDVSLLLGANLFESIANRNLPSIEYTADRGSYYDIADDRVFSSSRKEIRDAASNVLASLSACKKEI